MQKLGNLIPNIVPSSHVFIFHIDQNINDLIYHMTLIGLMIMDIYDIYKAFAFLLDLLWLL